MKFLDTWIEFVKQTLLYMRFRKRKGHSSSKFYARALRFSATRLVGPKRTDQHSPLIATLAVTSKCPCNCYHCSEGYKGGYELPREVVLGCIDDLVNLGCPVIALTGGEPFARPDFEQLIDRVPDSVAAVIYTSGIGLKEELARKLAGRPNVCICFSLDHTDPEEHDRRRGRKGAYDAVMRGIELTTGQEAQVHVSTLVTRDRLESGELVEFARAMGQLGVECLQTFQPRPVGKLESGLDLYLTPDEELRLFEVARELNRDPDAPLLVAYPAMEHPEAFGCCGGYARVYVDSHGNACPCDFAPLTFGNVNDESLAVIWGRMRGFFKTPGTRCLSRDNPEVFGPEREGRNVVMAELAGADRLLAPVPEFFDRFGESGYRRLLSNFLLAAVASAEIDHEKKP